MEHTIEELELGKAWSKAWSKGGASIQVIASVAKEEPEYVHKIIKAYRLDKKEQR